MCSLVIHEISSFFFVDVMLFKCVAWSFMKSIHSDSFFFVDVMLFKGFSRNLQLNE